MKAIVYILSFVFCAALNMSAQTKGSDIRNQEYKLATGIVYRSSDSLPYSQRDYLMQKCTLSVSYPYPASDLKKSPVIVWFHGGGLTSGKAKMPELLTNNGFVVVSAGYRLSPNVEIAQCIDDAAAAVAWVFENIERFGGDSSKIYIAGHSAGGYLVSMIGLDKHYLNKYGIDADRISAIIPYSGQVISHFAYRKQIGIDNALIPLIDQYAPLFHIRANAPAMMIITGDREKELYGRYEECAYFVRMMGLIGHKDIEFYELDGFDHSKMVTAAHYLTIRYIKTREMDSK